MMDEFISFISDKNLDLSKIKPSYEEIENYCKNQQTIANILGPNFMELGFTRCYKEMRYATVIWKQYQITFVNCMNLDVISFDFGGCLMATFTLNNLKYACHIHTDSDNAYDRMNDWQTFCTQNKVSDIRIFKPDTYLLHQYNNASELWGAITKEGNCYSILVTKPINNRIELKSIKKMNYYQGTIAQNALVKKCKYYHLETLVSGEKNLRQCLII